MQILIVFTQYILEWDLISFYLGKYHQAMFFFSPSAYISPHWHLLPRVPSLLPIISLISLWHSLVLCGSPSHLSTSSRAPPPQTSDSLTPPSFDLGQEGEKKKKFCSLTTLGSGCKLCSQRVLLAEVVYLNPRYLRATAIICQQKACGRRLTAHTDRLGLTNQKPVIQEMMQTWAEFTRWSLNNNVWTHTTVIPLWPTMVELYKEPVLCLWFLRFTVLRTLLDCKYQGF